MIFLTILCALVGIVGAIVPALPGPPVAWGALLFLHLHNPDALSPTFLIVAALVAVVITVLDFLVPVWGTKHFGGTKAGTRGSTLGLLAAMFLFPALGLAIGPFGIVSLLAGPFVGAWVGESLWGNKANALRSAFGSFVGFLAGTFMKLAYGIVVVVFVVKGLI